MDPSAAPDGTCARASRVAVNLREGGRDGAMEERYRSQCSGFGLGMCSAPVTLLFTNPIRRLDSDVAVGKRRTDFFFFFSSDGSSAGGCQVPYLPAPR